MPFINRIVLFFSFTVAILTTCPSPSTAALVSTPLLGMQESALQDRDFVFDLAGSEPVIDSNGGRRFVMDRTSNPALRLSNGRNGGGGTQALFKFAPCAFRTPHIHPRGTENFYVISGKIRANFIREAGGEKGQQAVVNEASAGFAGFFPEAHVHFLQNLECEEAVTLSTFDTSDAGLVDIAPSLRFQTDAVQLTLGNDNLIASDSLIQDVLMQSKQCLKRCRAQGGKR